MGGGLLRDGWLLRSASYSNVIALGSRFNATQQVARQILANAYGADWDFRACMRRRVELSC